MRDPKYLPGNINKEKNSSVFRVKITIFS